MRFFHGVSGVCFILVLTLTPLIKIVRAEGGAGAVVYTHETRKNPAQRLHILSVDLTNPGVRVVVRPGAPDPDTSAGPWETALETVRTVATRDGLYAAVNGGAFEEKLPADPSRRGLPYARGHWAKMSGRTMSDGKLWSEGNVNSNASVLVTKDGKVQIATFKTRPPPDAVEIATGFQQIVLNKKNVIRGGTEVAPRTAVGVDFASTKLIFLVVDGRRPDECVGMTDKQVADEMIRLGCHNAIALDGGGSSTMVLRDTPDAEPRLLNTPSDGSQFILSLSVERAVACVIGIKLQVPEGK